MSQFTVYKSSDGSAPVLTGQTGSLVALLKAILVDGYGAKAGAGWTAPYTNSTTGIDFLQGAGSRGMYCQVVDDGAITTSTFKEATMQGFEAMSAWNTLSAGGKFPTDAQFTAPGSTVGGVVFRKSAAADATARAWICFADSRTFYLFICSGDAAGKYNFYGFGDLFSLGGSGDTWATFCMGKGVSNAADSTSSTLNYAWKCPPWTTTPTAVTSIARSYTGTGASQLVNLATSQLFCVTATIGAGTLMYPNSVDGGLYMSPVYMGDGGTAAGARGRLRGLYSQSHAITNYADGDTFSGVGDYAGKTFYIVKSVSSFSNINVDTVCVVETSNTLESN